MASEIKWAGWRPDTGVVEYRGGEPPKPQAPVIEIPSQRTPAVTGWTPDKVTSLYSLAHSDKPPGWVNAQALTAIDAANNWMKQTGGAALPNELSGILDALTSAEAIELPPIFTPTPIFEQGPMPSLGNPAYYGLSDEEWKSLTIGQQLAMRAFSTGATSGAAIGAAAGVQGGAPGIAAGAVFGASLGALGERYPWIAKVGDAFDFLVENLVMKPTGLASLVGSALRHDVFGEETGVSLDDLIDDLDKAWLAGEQVFRTNLMNTGARPENYMGAQLTPEQQQARSKEVWAGPTAPTEYTTITPDKMGTAALQEYFDRLQDGEAPEDINRDFEHRFGFEGQMTDLAARVFLDPLNIAGGVMGQTIKAAGKLLGASDDFAKAFGSAAGPVEGAKRFKALAAVMSPEEAKSLKWFEKWASPYMAEGEIKILKRGSLDIQNPVARQFGYLFGQTPEARAKHLTNVAGQNFAIMAERAGMDVPQFIEYLDMVAKNPPDAAAQIGRFAAGSEVAATIPALRDILPGLKKTVADYYSPAMVDARRSLENIAARAGMSPGELVKALSDPNKGQSKAASVIAQIQRAAKAGGNEAADVLRAIETGELNPNSLIELTGNIKELPLNDAQLRALVYKDLIDGVATWSAKYFGVAPDALPIHLSNLVKSVQGALLLDLNPAFLIQNVTDNMIKLTREEGLMGFLTSGSPQKYIEQFLGEGIVPERIAEGLVTDTGAPHMVRKDAISAAKRHPEGGVLSNIEGGVRKVRELNPVSMSKISGTMEGKQRLLGNVVGIKQAMNELWQPGKGYPRIEADLARKLGPDVVNKIYGRIGSSLTTEQVISSVFDSAVKVDDVIPGVADNLGMRAADVQAILDHPNLGVMDYLRENLPANPTPEQVRGVFGNLMDHARKNFNEWSKQQKVENVKVASAKADVEGPIGLFSAFDDIGIERGMQRLNDWMEWDHLWDMKTEMTPEAWGKRVDMQYSFQRDAYRSLNENTRAIYLGALEELGADGAYTKLLADNLVAGDALWMGFYKQVQKEYRDFFRNKKGRAETFEASSARWTELRERLSNLYNETSAKSLELQAQRDGDLINLIGTRYDEATRAAAEAWLDGVREIDAGLYSEMEAFRKRVSQLPADERNAAWNEWLRKEHKPDIVERMRRNREGANEVYARAVEAERAGRINTEPQTLPKAAEGGLESPVAGGKPSVERRLPVARKMRAEIERLNKIIDELKLENEGLKTDPDTGLKLGVHHKEEINAAPVKMAVDVMGLKPINNLYGHPAGDILLKNLAETIHELGLNGFRNKTGGDEFTILFNSMDEAHKAEAMIHKIMQGKEIPVVKDGKAYTLKGFDVRAGIGETLEAADLVERAIRAKQTWDPGSLPPTVTVIEDVSEAVKGWAKDVGREPHMPEGIAYVDPIGNAPPGTVQGFAQYPPMYDLLKQGWSESVAPLLRELERAMLDPKNRDTTLANLDPQTLGELRLYLEQVSRQMSDTKLMAMKWGEISSDMAMLNYNDRYGIDNYLNMAVPYQFWYTRTAINWALTAIDRPAWFANWYRLREMQDKMQRQVPGLPQRLAGKLQIAVPFMPEGWGDTIYYDPYHQIFGFDQMLGQVMRPLLRDFSNTRSRAEYILMEMISNQEVSQAEANEALRLEQNSPLYQRIYAQAQAEIEAEIASPIDMVGAMTGYSLPVSWALERMGLKSKSRFGSTLPIFSTIQNVTALAGVGGPGGVHIPSLVQQLITGKPADNRGALWNYYVMRELSNMAAQGADPEEVKLAMIDKSGPLYDQAMSAVSRQQAVKSVGSLLWMDFFPEGEQRQRAIKSEFIRYADAGKLVDFFEKYPEYEARMMLRNADDPEALLNQFLRGAVWDGYYATPELERRAIADQLGDIFKNNFINKETRSYDSIDTATLVQWARAFNATVPETAPATPQISFNLPEASVSQTYDQYRNWQQAQPGYPLYSMMWSLPEGMRDQFKLQHPEVAAYQDQRYIFLAQHPEILPYVIGDDSYLAGAPPEVIQEVYNFYADRAVLFPMVKVIEAQYFNLDSKREKSLFLKEYPMLKDYWDWKKQAEDGLSAQAFYYVKGESGLDKLREGENYKAPYRIDYDRFSPELSLLLASAAMTGRPLGDGTDKVLWEMWKADGRPMGTFEAWRREVLQAFTWMPAR